MLLIELQRDNCAASEVASADVDFVLLQPESHAGRVHSQTRMDDGFNFEGARFRALKVTNMRFKRAVWHWEEHSGKPSGK